MFQFPDNINPVFKDSELQKAINENGYVIVPFLSDKEVAKLKGFYFDITKAGEKGFRPTTYNQNMEYRLAASRKIKEVAKPHLDNYLKNYKTYMGSYIVKHNDKNSELGVHQDMTLVDESRFMGMNTWVPLCDTNEQNGALYLIPKSHRIFPTYRNATIPNIYDKHYELIKKFMTPVYMKAGEAIFFDNSILHFSPINRSSEIRIAVNIFITHENAKITITYLDKSKNKIELFEQEDDFFTTYEQFGNDRNMERPAIGKSIGFRDYNFPVLTPQILKEKYGNMKSNSGIFDKIKEMIFK